MAQPILLTPVAPHVAAPREPAGRRRLTWGSALLAVLPLNPCRTALTSILTSAAVVLLAASATATATASATATAGTATMASLNPGDGRPAAAINPAAIQICVKVAAKAGFSFSQTIGTALGNEPRIAVAVAIAMAESSCDPDATNLDGDGSEDRGLWQMNNYAWPKISDVCAFQIQCNADAAYDVSADGANWSPWSTFSNGAWESYLASAVTAVESGFTFQLENQGTGTCLAADSADTRNGAPIVQWTCNAGDDSQQWKVVDSAGHLPVLQNVATGACLDADGMKSGNGAPIFQWACDSSNGSEQWWFNGSGDLNGNGNSDAGLQNSTDNTCVAADSASMGNGGKIFQRVCSAGDGYQEWN
jgi:hypothetical protein